MRRRKSKLHAPFTAATCALCTLPALALADEGQVAASTGVAFTASFGKQIEVGIGFDLRLSILTQGDAYSSCSSDLRSGLGPYMQAGWYSKTGWRIGAGAHGGTEVHESTYTLLGEFGWSYIVRARPLPGSGFNHR